MKVERRYWMRGCLSASLRLAGVRREARSPFLSLSRDRKESPFPGPNELPSFSRGRILHEARLDGRRADRQAGGGGGEGRARRRSSAKERKESFLAIVFARTFRAYFISSPSLLFIFSFVFSCPPQRRTSYVEELFSRCFARLFRRRLRKMIPRGLRDRRNLLIPKPYSYL